MYKRGNDRRAKPERGRRSEVTDDEVEAALEVTFGHDGWADEVEAWRVGLKAAMEQADAKRIAEGKPRVVRSWDL